MTGSRLLKLKGIPPSGVVLQIFGKPGKDDILPGQALLVVADDVVLALYLDVGDGAAQNFECREELLALVGGYVGVGRAVEQE